MGTTAGDSGLSLELPKDLKEATSPVPADAKKMIDRSEAFTTKTGGSRWNGDNGGILMQSQRLSIRTRLRGVINRAAAVNQSVP